MSVVLVCPDCRDGERLETQERVTACYPARFVVPQVGDRFTRSAGDAPQYTGARAGRVQDDGDVHCAGCGWHGDVADLAAPQTTTGGQDR